MTTDQLHRPDPAEGPLEGDRGGRGQPVVRLFTIPGSHPGVAAQLMLDHKGIPFKRTDLLPVVTWGCSRDCASPAAALDVRKEHSCAS